MHTATSRKILPLIFFSSAFALTVHAQTTDNARVIPDDAPPPSRTEVIVKEVKEVPQRPSPTARVMSMDEMVSWQRSQAAKNAPTLTFKSAPLAPAKVDPIEKILPIGINSYTYYSEPNIYFNPRAKVFYSLYGTQWGSSPNAPRGARLGVGRTVYLSGQAVGVPGLNSAKKKVNP